MTTRQKGDIMYSPTKRTLNNKTSGSKVAYTNVSPPRLNNKYYMQEQPLLVRNMYDEGNYYFYNNGYNASAGMSNGGSPINGAGPFVYNPMLPGATHVSPTRKKKVGLNRNPRNNNVVMPSSPIKNNNLLSGSTTRHNVVHNNNNTGTNTKKYKELKDVDELERKPFDYNTANLKARYFGPVEPLKEESERKPNVNMSYKTSKNKQKRQPVVYRISTPIASNTSETPDTSYLLPDSEKYYALQPIKLLHSKNIPHFLNLHDISTELLDETLSKKKNKHLQPVGNAIQNDSFDLSFDGKALDRSDILRMVDSFSVAFSDDEDNEDSFIARNNNDILPAEMTNNR
ncbi:hypothetical protein RNJ44_03699 [Nakaseomyces bracarensis]|uniref:Uncharacterized protein n=1 Tax=Nakaseomyces bracarensis TaxID=273131 RepID=A0ABR4NXS7_9SACH